MTLSELARLANVSVSVASKAFSGRGDVSEAMRNHVFNVAKKHGCFHQFYSVPYDHRVVALIIPEAISKYYIRYVEAIKAQLEKNNCTMLLSISNFDPQMEAELIRYYSEHGKVDALIVVNGYCNFPVSDDIVFVKIGGMAENADVTVYLDPISGTDDCLKALKECGHKRVAFVGEPLTVSKGKFLAGRMEAAGLELREEYFITSNQRFEEAGVDGIQRLLSLNEPPDAIIGAYGYISAGILSELAKKGVSVPQDVSVVSMAPYPMPSELGDVSRIEYDIDAICKTATDELCRRFDSKGKHPRANIVVNEMFHKGSTI